MATPVAAGVRTPSAPSRKDRRGWTRYVALLPCLVLLAPRTCCAFVSPTASTCGDVRIAGRVWQRHRFGSPAAGAEVQRRPLDISLRYDSGGGISDDDWDFDDFPRSILSRAEEAQRDEDERPATAMTPAEARAMSNRRIFMASAMAAFGAAIGPYGIGATAASAALDRRDSGSLRYVASPVNKRSGVSVYDAERSGYNVRFITYLSRFLLSFDAECQRWWYARAADIPRTATAEELNALRLKQFGAFSASVEVGLQEFGGPDGPRKLLESLLRRYCPDVDSLSKAREEKGLPALNSVERAKQQREIREARRQIALLFGLMQTYQPVQEITKVLAAIDNATVTSVFVSELGSGYAPGYGPPLVTFPAPKAVGDEFERARGKAILGPTGRILRIDIKYRGQGYSKAPAVTISPPAVERPGSSQASAEAYIFKQGPNKGRLQRIQLVDPGSGYRHHELIEVAVSPPDLPLSKGGVAAMAQAVPELGVKEIQVTSGGSGYAVEKPIRVKVEPPPPTAWFDMNDPIAASLASANETINEYLAQSAQNRTEATPLRRGRPATAIAYPSARKDSFASFRLEADGDMPSGANSPRKVRGTGDGDDSGIPSVPSWGGGTTPSTQLLTLLPSGIGLEYDTKLKRYALSIEEEFVTSGAARSFRERSLKPLDPEFGPRGRSPVERDLQLDLPTFLRFCLSGAICCSAVHLALTPIDVVKTKVQTNPEKYPDLVSALRTVATEEGLGSFFTGWAPTFLGFFVAGASAYSVTEFFRRYFAELAGPAMAGILDVPIILAAATLSAICGAVTIAPFEAVRVRSVAQPDYADSIVGVLERIVDEEGVPSLFSAVPAFLPKEITFSCAKFVVFDLSTQWLYDAYPVAREDLQLSLLVSLAGGTLGGIAAAIVSNPADATISELKKAKTDMGPVGAFKSLLEKGGIPSLFRGLEIRMIFYIFLVSLQFLVYDAVRFSLGIGSDDLKLYLDVLGGALKQSGGPV